MQSQACTMNSNVHASTGSNTHFRDGRTPASPTSRCCRARDSSPTTGSQRPERDTESQWTRYCCHREPARSMPHPFRVPARSALSSQTWTHHQPAVPTAAAWTYCEAGAAPTASDVASLSLGEWHSHTANRQGGSQGSTAGGWEVAEWGVTSKQCSSRARLLPRWSWNAFISVWLRGWVFFFFSKKTKKALFFLYRFWQRLLCFDILFYLERPVESLLWFLDTLCKQP